MNIKDLNQRPLPPKYTDETNSTINLLWLYEVISSYEDHATVGALLTRNLVSKEEFKTIREVYLEEAAINIFSYGGATVIQADFTPDKKASFTHATNLCKEWMNCVPEDENKKDIINLILVPLLFEAKLQIVFTNLIYYDSQFNGGNLRLILVFDETATDVIQNEDINFEEIFIETEREVKSEIKKIEDENFALMKEIEEMEKSHDFENKVKADMQNIADPTQRILEQKAKNATRRENNPFMRIRKDEDDE